MNRRCFVQSVFACGLTGPISRAQGRLIQPDLAKLADSKDLDVVAGSVVSSRSGNRTGLSFPQGSGGGLAYLKGIEFANGAIELELKGADIQQSSFLGVVFHGVDNEIHDGIYFRPFNFRVEDAARRVRAVQYHSLPAHRWDKLRAEHPGKYEQAVNPTPNPNDWFHARIVVASPKVSVFVENAKDACLVVNQLSDRKRGRIGLWANGGALAEFANLRIDPA